MRRSCVSSVSASANRRVTEPGKDKQRYRRPESVLVIIHAADLQCLLLERLDPAGFWQSVTGSLHWGELPALAAAREVQEETGLVADGLVDTGVSHSFPIFPQWLDRYEPGVTENTEHLWFMRLPEILPIRLSESEHRSFQWLPVEQAAAAVGSWTNRKGLELLMQRES